MCGGDVALCQITYTICLSAHTHTHIHIHMYVVMMSVGKYRYHAVKSPYPTEVPIDPDFGYIDVGSVVVQNEYIFVQVRFTNSVIAHGIDVC